MERTWTILQAAVTVVMTVATAVLGFTLPAIWGMAGDIGGLKARADEFSGKFVQVQAKLDGIEGKIDAIARKADGIEVYLTRRDTDPNALLAQAGLRPMTEFAGARIGNKFVIFPKTDAAHAELAQSGFKREAVAPSIFGYVAGEYDTTGAVRLMPPVPRAPVEP
jgi:hypothetical protein